MKTIGTHFATWLTGGTRFGRQLGPFLRYMALLVGIVVLYGVIFHVIMAWDV